MRKKISLFIIPVFFAYSLTLSCGPPKPSDKFATDSVSIAGGQTLFNKDCSGCHNFKQNGIGPDLSGVTDSSSADWIQQFIRGPKAILESGDEHTKKLLAHYHTLMPSFDSLKETEMNQLLAFLHTKKTHKKEIEDPLAIKDPIPEKIEASDIQADLEELVQMPATSDKEPLTRISKMDWVNPAKSWFVLDQRGKLYKLKNQKPITWLEIAKWKPNFINEPGLATGFGSFAFHPDYARNGIFYTTHSEAAHTKKTDFAIPDSVKQTLQWVLCEWKTSDPLAEPFKGSCRELLRIDMVSGIHGIQEIIFNPLVIKGDSDYGMLYIGVGDGGSAENGYIFLTHHPDKIWGTILRINPSGNNSANKQYGIPESNPYAGAKDSDKVREIYADGFRNPNRITWTKQGIMLATNIGQANIEALNIILKGHHYGWPIREGRFEMHPASNINNIYKLSVNDTLFHITYPVAIYDHDEGNAIAGGFEYTGNSVPEFKGKYLFGDIPTGRLFFVNIADLQDRKSVV